MSKGYGTVPTIEGQEVTVDGVVPGDSKRGHKCCGGCCDVRRATIIVNIISIVTLFLNLSAVFLATQVTEYIDDDEVVTAIDMMPTSIIAGIYIIEIILLGVTIHGAMNFQAGKVLVGLILYGIAVVLFLLTLNIPGLIINALFLYPHYFLYQEIKSGIMSESTYHVEEQSCCCV